MFLLLSNIHIAKNIRFKFIYTFIYKERCYIDKSFILCIHMYIKITILTQKFNVVKNGNYTYNLFNFPNWSVFLIGFLS